MNQKLGRRRRKQLPAAVGGAITSPPGQRYFHGGNAGLKIGGFILPPSKTGAKPNGTVPAHIRRKNRIYLVKAAPWAAHHSKPVIYEVEAVGNVVDDPDGKIPGISFEAQRAKIVAIHDIPADMLQAARQTLRQLADRNEQVQP